MVEATYVLPIRRDDVPAEGELISYLRDLVGRVEVIVVDGSPPPVFAAHARALGPEVRHLPPRCVTPNGKVGGVVTGVGLASHERVIVADDDVRYSPQALQRVVALLDHADVVRPQNYFDPLPWHARWDSARSLLNRTTGGDWPGTLGLRRSILLRTGGYEGGVLFENLELVRTMKAVGGTETVALDLYVRRRPPTAPHFWSQRVRQAYDELARPPRFLLSLAVIPVLLALAVRRRWVTLAALAASVSALAEAGRRRAGGSAYFPPTVSLLAPGWLLERGVSSWLALGARLFLGGIPYHGSVLYPAATPMRELRRRHGPGPAEAAERATVSPLRESA